jgi:hypothetical protein
MQLLWAADAVSVLDTCGLLLTVAAGCCALCHASEQRSARLRSLSTRTAATDSDTDSSDDDDATHDSECNRSGVVAQQPRQQGQYALVPQLDSSAAMV